MAVIDFTSCRRCFGRVEQRKKRHESEPFNCRHWQRLNLTVWRGLTTGWKLYFATYVGYTVNNMAHWRDKMWQRQCIRWRKSGNASGKEMPTCAFYLGTSKRYSTQLFAVRYLLTSRGTLSAQSCSDFNVSVTCYVLGQRGYPDGFLYHVVPIGADISSRH